MIQYVQRVYDSATGALKKEFRTEGVDDLFANGMPCDILYADMLSAYQRLRDRLATDAEDPDAETMINALLEICRIVGCKMYEYGAKLGNP